MCAAAGRPRLFSDGPTMWNSLTTSVGYLNAEGYCYNNKCHVRFQPCAPFQGRLILLARVLPVPNRQCNENLTNAQVFPIVLSEFGSALNERTELDCFTSITNYLTSTGLANDGRHAPIQSWFYWWACLSIVLGGVLITNSVLRKLGWKARMLTALPRMQGLER